MGRNTKTFGDKMKKAQEDNDLFKIIYDRTFVGLRKFVIYKAVNSALVDDILQEVYLEVFRHMNKLKEHGNIEGWIYKTAENKTKKLNEIYYKYYGNKSGIEEEIVYEERALTELIQGEEYQSILTEDEFLLLMMKYKAGYSHGEIAKIRKITEASSKMKLSRIIKKLKEHMNLFLML